MFSRKILIRERFRSINRHTPCPISIQEISSLNHEIFNLVHSVYIFLVSLIVKGGCKENKTTVSGGKEGKGGDI